MTTDLQILMPMGGLGSRFAKEGYTTPKPLITVDGVPMFMRALQSFKPLQNVSYIFVIRREHETEFNLSRKIIEQLPNSKITIIDGDTRGAVETCLAASSSIDEKLPIIIADCDIYFESSDYFKVVNRPQDQLPDGMLLTFESDDDRYSYVRLGEHQEVVETAEKVVISNHAILGGYFFKSGKTFLNLANEFVQADLPPHLKEFYLSHLFNILIEKKGTVLTAEVDTKHIFGTPEELNAYLHKTNENNP